MKKIIYGGLFLAVLGIGFVGCNKNMTPENDINSTPSELLIFKKIDELNKGYKLASNHQKASTDWGKKLTADALGCVGGSRWGTSIGGFPWGTGIGAAIGAGAASYFAGIDLGDGSIDIFEANILAYDLDINMSNPNDNPYNYVGYRHNYILRELLLKNLVYDSQVTTRNLFSNVMLSNNERQTLSGMPENFYTFFYGDRNYEEICNFLRIEFPSSQSEVLIMESYFDVASNLSNFADFMTYTNSFEKLIVESSEEELNLQVKAIVLMSLSVAKHSGDFWHSVVN